MASIQIHQWGFLFKVWWYLYKSSSKIYSFASLFWLVNGSSSENSALQHCKLIKRSWACGCKLILWLWRRQGWEIALLKHRQVVWQIAANCFDCSRWWRYFLSDFRSTPTENGLFGSFYYVCSPSPSLLLVIWAAPLHHPGDSMQALLRITYGPCCA